MTLFPPSPSAPPGFTDATKAYGRHAWLALAGLLSFVGLYLGLTGYLAWIIYRLLIRSILYGGNIPAAFFLSLPALFFFAFLVSGFFVVQRGKERSLVQLKPEDEPALLAFLAQLADETRAPRPHKVFVSADVNASVFYDISFWNFIFPSKKNLVLGLGLVNVLTLDQLKAVIAHEYGHFAQRTMAVGRWVYIAQQAAGHVIASRTVFDKILFGLSNIDIRIAWIGWILRVFVWAFRAVLDTGFRLVVLTYRALGREMEFQADRVAVSVSGSDSLVHALHRLGPADEAWEEAMTFAVIELLRGQPVDDLLAFQTAALDHMRRVLDEPEYGRTPKRPPYAADHRVFDGALAHPPRMWMTHPFNREREDQAKAIYLPSTLDARDAWLLFRDPPALRRAVTAKTFEEVKLGEPKEVEGTQLERLAKRFSGTSLNTEYRGVYLGRSIAAYDKNSSTMRGRKLALDRDQVLTAIDALYPPSLRAELTAHRERYEEEKMLQGLADGVLTAPGGVIRYRGKEIGKHELRGVVEQAGHERRKVEQRLLEHDRACRAAHLRAAELLGGGWAEYLDGLIDLLHYATHAGRNITDARGALEHVLEIVLADGRVSNAERERVVAAANELRRVLVATWKEHQMLKLPITVQLYLDRMGQFTAFDQELGLPAANAEILSEWLSAMDGWTSGAVGKLEAIAQCALNALLDGEARVAKALREGIELEEAPARAGVPKHYASCVLGAERERQKKLDWWDRFQTADGLFPGALRAGVASALLLPVMFLGARVGSTTVHVANGLSHRVSVKIEGKELGIAPRSTAVLELGALEKAHVETHLHDGRLLEGFDQVIGGGFVEVAYNVGQATSFAQQTVIYGEHRGREPPPLRALGAPRWMDAPQSVVFRAPPESVQVKVGQTETRTALLSAHEAGAGQQLALVTDPEERRALIRVHLLYDRAADASLGAWLEHAEEVPDARAILEQRLAESTEKVAFERAIQIQLQGEERAARCAAANEASARTPGDPDALYLALRCPSSERVEEVKSELWISAFEKHRDHPWISYGATQELARVGRWKDALAAFELAYASDRTASVRDTVAIEYWRASRAAKAAGVESVLPPALRQDPVLSFLSSIERNNRIHEPVTRAYRGLYNGDFAAALSNAAQSDHATAQRMFVLVGASDGATPAQIKAALAVRLEDLDLTAACLLSALRIREGSSANGAAAPVLVNDTTRACGPVEAIVRDPAFARRPEPLAAFADQQVMSARGLAYAMGAIALGDRAPAGWRAQAKATLFPTEHPYFK